MNKGLLLSVLNEQPIDASTKHIELRIKAEIGFNPQTDVDVESLRFGSFTEVNFGRGCKPLKTRNDGDDLIVTFSGKGSGITADEFAPKLIGRDKKGGLLYGYAHLPYVDYSPALLSARKPQHDRESDELTLKIGNFGLSASQPARVEVKTDNQTIATGEVSPLSPYEEVELRLKPASTSLPANPTSYEVVIRCGNTEVERVSWKD